jgi:pimeloyl-ACP methyl ester carboxylesterase
MSGCAPNASTFQAAGTAWLRASTCRRARHARTRCSRIALPAANVSEVEARGEAVVDLVRRPFAIRRSLVEEAQAREQGPCIATLGRALLVMHAPPDGVAGVDNALAIFEAARHPKSFVTIDGADHLLSRRKDATYATRVLAAWASHFLPAPEAPRPHPQWPQSSQRKE